jgi:adenylate cyclase
MGIIRKQPTPGQGQGKSQGQGLIAAKLQVAGLTSLAVVAAVLGLRLLGSLQGAELATYDRLLRSRPVEADDDRLLVVGIDETDIQSRQEWPIQDQTLADAIAILEADDPRAIGIDIFRDIPMGDGRAALINQINDSPRIVAACRISSPTEPGVPPPPVPPEAVGFADFPVDRGGTLRRTLLLAQPPEPPSPGEPHLCSDPDELLPSLSFQLALRYLNAENIELDATPQQEIQLADVVLRRLQPNLGGYRQVDSQGYQMLLNFRSGQAGATVVSLSQVLSGQVAADQIRDRIILIGYTTPEAKDDFYTPYSQGLADDQKLAGVLAHAQATSQILSAVLDDRPLIWAWPAWGESLWILVWGTVGGLFAVKVRRPVYFALGLGVLSAGLYGSGLLLLSQGGWVPLVPPALTLILAAGGVVLVERFNQSTYGQAVYRQVKTILKIDIDIDEEKVERQVAEITETDYFNQLQQKARELRTGTGPKSGSASIAAPKANGSSTQPAPPAETEDIDYLSQLQQKAKSFKAQQGQDPPTED